MGVELLSGPAAPAVALVDAKAHMRVDIVDDDALITGLVAAAQEHVEDVIGRKLIKQQWRVIFDRFTQSQATYVFFNRLFVPSVFDIDANHLTPDKTRTIKLPFAPVISIDQFNVIDSNGDGNLFDPSNFIEDTVSEPARIVLKEDSDWPYPQADLQAANAVQIDFTVGYGVDVTTVPKRIVLAIKMLAAHWYENREHTSPLTMKEVPMGVSALLAPFLLWDREDDPSWS